MPVERAGIPTFRRRGGAGSRPVRSQRRRLSRVRGFLRSERGTTADKYSGSYKSRLFKRLADYTGPRTQARSVRDLFRLFVLNCALRNGDAHLKNFGILYRDVNGDAELAPVSDLVTTTAYLPRDAMALTLEGSTRWPEARRLLQLGQTRAGLAKKDVEGIFEATAQALWETSGGVEKYFRSSGFPDIGARMTVAWEEGIRESLDLIKGRARTGAVATERAKKGEVAGAIGSFSTICESQAGNLPVCNRSLRMRSKFLSAL